MTANNLFNFADTSDLPDEIREALETQTTDNARKYAGIVKAAAEAGLPSLNIRQVEAAVHRAMKQSVLGFTPGELPTTATVRAYLNAAVKLKLIGKPTRNSYGADASVVSEGDEAEEQPVAQEAAAGADPLAGL